ncbi:cystathionine gamma-synthase [Kribbella sp. VKM Ac-2566]|nr:cystathionine gamma-synthase [Kribbella sp. VKM Ac-2566]
MLQHSDALDEADSDVAPAMYLSVPFSAGSAAEFASLNRHPRHERFYRRYGNPSQARLERAVSAIEGAEAALATASGMAAISTTVLTLLSAGDHLVAQRSMYGGTLSFLQDVAPRFGLEVTLVDDSDVSAFERAIRPRTRLFMVESPSNPRLQVSDVGAVAALARSHDILTFADNTIATPANHRPIEDGVDLVMHSVTKQLSGHSDVMAGIVLGSKELIDAIWKTHTMLGSVISPFDAWLALRGLRTLSLRVERQNQTALAVAEFLAAQPAVAQVNYPGLVSHPQHDLAKRQMRGYGGLLSFELRGGAVAGERLIDALRIPVRSSSLGGFRSLVIRPAAMWAHELSDEQLVQAGVPAGLIRFSVGLESTEDLITDLDQALEAVASDDLNRARHGGGFPELHDWTV